MRNVLITGTPRSGTTLVCSLLNKVPDVVALHEPMNVFEFVGRKGDEVAKIIQEFCAESRKSLHENKFAISKHVGGKVRDNSATADRSGKRTRQTEHGRIKIDKPLSQDFTLAIKHPAAFTALLEPLSEQFECCAIVRNPLATLGSWNSLDWFPLKDGKLPVGEKLDLDLARELAKLSDKIDRQIHVLEWFHGRFRRFLQENAILKYEDVIGSRARELAKIVATAEQLNEDLSSKNVSEFYDRDLMTDIAHRMLKRDGALWNFYSKREVEELLKEMSSTSPNR
jgi:Sulfotransferase family